MKILLIRPKPSNETIGLQHIMIVEPLELEILATLVEKRHSVRVVDMIFENEKLEFFLDKYKPNVVGFTGYITHNNLMIDSCSRVKNVNKDIITIVGGVHVEKLPETINHPDVDYRVVRNASIAFPQLMDFLEGNDEFPLGVLSSGEELDEAKLPDYNFETVIPNRELISKYRGKYFYIFHENVALLKTSFGCPYNCNFCYCRVLTGKQYIEREMDIVIEELKAIKEKEIYIIDDDFLVSEKRLNIFMDRLEEHNIKKNYLVYGRSDFIVKNPELLKRFKKLGLRSIIVGLESFDDEDLITLNKDITQETNEQTMNILNDIGVECYGCIIVMPYWTHEHFNKMTKKLIDLKIHFINIQPLTPLLKTDLKFDESKLIIPREEYEKWDLAHVVIEPEHMSVKEFYSSILKMYDKILFRPSNLIHNLKYSPRMQIKLLKGALKVRKQYKEKILNSI